MGGNNVTHKGCIPNSCFSFHATCEPSFPPLQAAITSQLELSLFRYLSHIFSSSRHLVFQSIFVLLVSSHWHALQTPLSSKVILGRVDIFTHFVQKCRAIFFVLPLPKLY